MEDLAARITPPRPAARSLRAVTAHEALIRARTCYDHLAGQLGVAIADALIEQGFVDQRTGLALTPEGMAFLTDRLGIDPQALAPGRRPLIRACLDWTQRRTHLAGVVGAEICRTLLRRGWVERIGTGRAVRVTPAGRRALRDTLGLASVQDDRLR